MKEKITSIRIKAKTYKEIRKYYEKAKEEKRTICFDDVISGILSITPIDRAVSHILKLTEANKSEEK